MSILYLPSFHREDLARYVVRLNQSHNRINSIKALEKMNCPCLKHLLLRKDFNNTDENLFKDLKPLTKLKGVELTGLTL